MNNKNGETGEASQTSAASGEGAKKGTDSQGFNELYEESFKNIQEGEILQGQIISVSKDYVMVDVGYKSEGQIPIAEFTTRDGVVEANVGDEVDVYVDKRGEEDGMLLLSRNRAARIKAWTSIEQNFSENSTVQGKVVGRVKGGYTVDIGVPAFLPASQADIRPVKDQNSLIGTAYSFKIIKVNRKRSNVVVSRRVLLEEEREHLKANTLATISPGQTMEGSVKNITDYGVFIDLGGIDGLLHVTDISWGRVEHPSKIFQIGENLKVKILGFNPDNEKVSLGLKQLCPDPWESVESKYKPGEKATGKVVSLTDYGAFIELDEGVEGLVHVSEMSWAKKVRHPSQLVAVGDVIEVMILNADAKAKRISLGLKQVKPNPWEVIADKYPRGTVIEGKVKNITDFGIFVGIEEGIDGLIHISDLSWTKRVKHPGELYQKGQVIQAVVLNVDREQEKFTLGIKQLLPDPWSQASVNYLVGKRVSGKITNITDFGMFIQLEEGIEGLIHISEIVRDESKPITEQFTVGDAITAQVINVAPEDRKIGLSTKRLKVEDERTSYVGYLGNAESATSTLGDLLKGELNNNHNKAR